MVRKKFYSKFFSLVSSVQDFYFNQNPKMLFKECDNMRNEKISVMDLIQEEQATSEETPSEQARTESEIRNEKLLKIAFYLQSAILKFNGHYLRSVKNYQYAIYTPKNASATIHFLDNNEVRVSQPRTPRPQEEQAKAINQLREIEQELINAQIGYMPYLQD